MVAPQNLPTHWVCTLHLFHLKSLFFLCLYYGFHFVMMPSPVWLRFCQWESIGVEDLHFPSCFYFWTKVFELNFLMAQEDDSWVPLLELFLANCRCRDSTTSSGMRVIRRRQVKISTNISMWSRSNKPFYFLSNIFCHTFFSSKRNQSSRTSVDANQSSYHQKSKHVKFWTVKSFSKRPASHLI